LNKASQEHIKNQGGANAISRGTNGDGGSDTKIAWVHDTHAFSDLALNIEPHMAGTVYIQDAQYVRSLGGVRV